MAETVVIESIGHRGDGIAATHDGPLYVPFALPGERVAVEREGQRGRIVELVVASPERVAPVCRHFGECGGCADTVGWCYTPRSKAYGQTCKSDKECTTDRCSADCYVNPTGSCLCDSDSHCGTNQYCGWGFNSGKCQNKKGRGAA